MFRKKIISGIIAISMLLIAPVTAFGAANAIGSGGAAATEDPLSTQVAIDILDAGGNAVDAAIAASAVQGVVRPFSGGIGGGGYMLIYLADTEDFVVLDHRSEAPSTFDETTFLDQYGNEYADETRQMSGLAVGVPGLVKAWEQALNNYGSGLFTLGDLLQPAIDIAENGFYADQQFIDELTANAPRFRCYQSTIDTYLEPDGDVPPVNTLMINQDLADTYSLIAQYGSSIFYNGAIGQAVVSTVNTPPAVQNPPLTVLAGDISLSDLQGYTVPEYDAVSVNYRGYDVYGAPPSSSGGVTLGLALNILEGYDMSSLSREEALHYYIEACRYAYADRYAYLGDPLTYQGDLPITGLLSKNYAESVRQKIAEYGTQYIVDAGDPWPYDSNPNLWSDPLPSAGREAFSCDFTGVSNGASWDSTGEFTTQKKSAAETIDVQSEAGNIYLDSAQYSYARAESDMEPVPDSELLVRFKVDQLTDDRRLRFWLRADAWNSTTSPHNGYGVEISTSADTVRFIRTRDSNPVYGLATFSHTRTTDWQWLRFRVEGDQLKVRIWNDGEYEPRDTWTYTLQDTTVSGEGKLLISALELTGGTYGGSFKVDDIYVSEVNPLAFDEDFTGVSNGSSWDSTGSFTTAYSSGSAIIDVQSENGRMYLDDTQYAYARATSDMDNLYDSELLVKFKMTDLTQNRKLRFWLRADSFNSSTCPYNGYGVEFQTLDDEIRLIRTRDGNALYSLKELNHTRTTDWQWLRFRVEDEAIKVKVWTDGSSEPVDWLHMRTSDTVAGPGKLLIGAVELTGGGGAGGSFLLDDIQVYDLDVVKPQTSTIHLTTSDSDGNIVSYTHTLNAIGGNAMVVPGYGFLLNDTLAPRVPSAAPVGHPDGPRAGMRPLSSMTPTIVMHNGAPVLALGSPGGQPIINNVLQVLINYLDFGMSLPDAIAADRLSQTNNSLLGNTLIEPDFVYETEYNALKALGQLLYVTEQTQGIGMINAIEFLPNDRVQACSETWRRGGGSAMVQIPD